MTNFAYTEQEARHELYEDRIAKDERMREAVVTYPSLRPVLESTRRAELERRKLELEAELQVIVNKLEALGETT